MHASLSLQIQIKADIKEEGRRGEGKRNSQRGETGIYIELLPDFLWIHCLISFYCHRQALDNRHMHLEKRRTSSLVKVCKLVTSPTVTSQATS